MTTTLDRPAGVPDWRVGERLRNDPIWFVKTFWPDIYLTNYQREIMLSVRDNNQTVVVAGNQLGKDFVAGLITLWWFCSRRPARVVTTGPTEQQVEDILWGEITRFIQTSRANLPVKASYLTLKQISDEGDIIPGAEVVGMVSKKEGLLGRHSTGSYKAQPYGDIPRTLLIIDEGSGVHNNVYQLGKTWAHRILIIGNAFPCENDFKWAFKGKPGTDDKGGDISRPNGRGYYRKTFRITAADSPNVRLGLAQIANGLEPDGRVLVPGVKTYDKYCEDRLLWSPQLQKIGLDAEWWDGDDTKLYPSDWLAAAIERAKSLGGSPCPYCGRRHRDAKIIGAGTVGSLLQGRLIFSGVSRKALALGVDSAAGGDFTAWVVVDRQGVLHLRSEKTPNTAVIPDITCEIMRTYGLMAEQVLFDAGGGGQQHADLMRSRGYKVRTVGFGDPAKPEPKRGMTTFDQKKKDDETRYVYKNRRAEMYGILAGLLNPVTNPDGFGIPGEECNQPNHPYSELHRQLAVIPEWLDEEGRLFLPPKKLKSDAKDDDKVTLTSLIGRSPDEADALVLACYGITNKQIRRTAGAIG